MNPEIVIAPSRAVAVNVSSADQSLNNGPGFPYARGFLIGGAGNLAITTPGGDAVVLESVSGQIWICAVSVQHTGTTATGVTALY